MKLLFQNIKRLIIIIVENIFLLTGAYLFTHNLFSFENGVHYDIEGGAADLIGLDPSASYTHPAVYYYYNNETIANLALGVILIILGLLLIKERYYKK
jgi:hypothetical protein